MRDWIFRENLRGWLEIVAGVLAYSFDDDDWDAVRFGLVDTDVEKAAWYEYPLGSAQVRLALDPGTEVVAVSLDHADHFVTEFAMATRIAQTYLLVRRR